MAVLDPDWFSNVAMERIIVHWTAGTYDISDNDTSHYHFLIDKDGAGYLGDNPVSGNAREGGSGATTSHVKNFNTGSIGISVAAMGNAVESPFDPGDWPITKIQFFALCVACAQLCEFYNLPVTDTTVLMHGEVQDNCGVQQDGKWDIGRLPFAPDQYKDCREVGDFMRALIVQIMEGGWRPILPEIPSVEKTVTISVRIDAPPGVKVVVVQEES